MATRAAVITVPNVDITARVVTWSGLLQSSSDVGAGHQVADASELMALINSGTLGAAGAITWQGSIDNTNWFTLTSRIGTPANVVQTALLTPTMIQERPIYVRPSVTAGDGTTTLVAALVIKRPVA